MASYYDGVEIEKLSDYYSLYLYNPYSGIIDYGVGIEVQSSPNFDKKLSEEDIEVALKNKTIKNGFTFANFNKIGLKEQLIEILKNVKLTIDLIQKETKKQRNQMQTMQILKLNNRLNI